MYIHFGILFSLRYWHESSVNVFCIKVMRIVKLYQNPTQCNFASFDGIPIKSSELILCLVN